MTEAAESIIHEGRELLLVRESELENGTKDSVYADELTVLHISMDETNGTTHLVVLNRGE